MRKTITIYSVIFILQLIGSCTTYDDDVNVNYDQGCTYRDYKVTFTGLHIDTYNQNKKPKSLIVYIENQADVIEISQTKNFQFPRFSSLYATCPGENYGNTYHFMDTLKSIKVHEKINNDWIEISNKFILITENTGIQYSVADFNKSKDNLDIFSIENLRSFSSDKLTALRLEPIEESNYDFSTTQYKVSVEISSNKNYESIIDLSL